MTIFASFAPRIAHAVTATLVQVVNTASNPVPVQGVHARQAVQLNLSFSMNAGTTFNFETYQDGSFQPYTVPSGKRLVIELGSAFCNVPAGQTIIWPIVSSSIGSGFANVTFNQHFDGTDGTNSFYSLSLAGPLYADPATQVTVSWNRSGSSGQANCQFSATGHLEDIQ
jgi:hypothetical protein